MLGRSRDRQLRRIVTDLASCVVSSLFTKRPSREFVRNLLVRSYRMLRGVGKEDCAEDDEQQLLPPCVELLKNFDSKSQDERLRMLNMIRSFDVGATKKNVEAAIGHSISHDLFCQAGQASVVYGVGKSAPKVARYLKVRTEQLESAIVFVDTVVNQVWRILSVSTAYVLVPTATH